MSATQGATKEKGEGIPVSPKDGPFLSVFPLIRVLTRRRWQLLACLLLVCTVAFAATAMRKPRFEAVARVEVVMDQPSISGLSGLASNLSGNYFSTQCQLLQSRHVLEVAAKKLNMSGGQWAVDNEGIKALRKNVKIQPVAGSRLIDIVGISEVAPMASAIANQITAAFIETSTEARLAAAKGLIGRVNQQIQVYDAEIQGKENVVSKFRQEQLITGNDTTLSAVETRIRVIEQELTASQMKRLDLESQRLQIERTLASGQGMSEQEETIRSIRTDPPQMTRLKQTLATLKSKESQLAQVYLSGHPKLYDVRLRIADLQTQLLDQKQNAMQGRIKEITEDYMTTVKQEESLLTLLNQQKELGVRLTEKYQQFTELLNDLNMHRRFRQECLARVREFELQEGMAESPVVVIDAAQIPSKPAGLSKTHQAASILLIGILFSLAFVLSLDRLGHSDQTSQASAGRYQTMPMPYGMVPNWPGAYWAGPNQANPSPPQQPVTQANTMRMVSQEEASALGQLQNIELGQNNYDDRAFNVRCRIVHADQSSAEAAAFREMSNQLIHRFGQTHQSLVITSSKEHEGKTTCACNLALGLAKAGRKVLLVDANQENPALHKVFDDSDGQASFQDVLLDRELLENATQDSEVSGLTILSGTGDHTENQHYDAKDIESLLHQLKDRFDWVVFDASTTDDALTKELLSTVSKCLLVDGIVLRTAFGVKRADRNNVTMKIGLG